jgi:hypothetical protein
VIHGATVAVIATIPAIIRAVLLGIPVRVPPARSRGRGVGTGVRVIRRPRGIRPALAPVVTGAVIVPILPTRAGIGRPGVAILITAAGGVLTIIITPWRVTVIIASGSILTVIITRGVMTVKIPFRPLVIAVKIPLRGLIPAIIIPAGWVTLVTTIPAVVTVAVTGTVVAIAVSRFAIRAFRATGTIR